LVAEAGVRPGELVVDLGAGTGALTRPLLDAGAEVLAVELHPGRVAQLRASFPAATVIQASIEELRFPRRPFRVVANPPFAAGSALVRRLLESRVTEAHLVLPVQVGQRWQQRRPDRVSYTRLPRSAFRPAARVPTAVVHLRRR
jgi:23S rRNA (adenine-N6)-dimethyltransferase